MIVTDYEIGKEENRKKKTKGKSYYIDTFVQNILLSSITK